MIRVTLAVALTLLPWPAFGQSALSSSDADLQQRLRQRKVIVQPKPSADTVTRDAEQAVDDLAARQRRDETLRELNQPGTRRPDLDQNVTGGIQTRNLNSVRPR